MTAKQMNLEELSAGLNAAVHMSQMLVDALVYIREGHDGTTVDCRACRLVKRLAEALETI